MTKPVLGSSTLSSNYLITLKLDGTIPLASPLWTPSLSTDTLRSAFKFPLKDVVIQRVS